MRRHQIAYVFALALGNVVVSAAYASAGASDARADAAGTGAAEPAQAAPKVVLTKGMTADEVRTKIGRPHHIKQVENPDVAAEIWVYRRVVTSETTQVPARTRDVPMVDPITGAIKMVPEPEYVNAIREVIETTELLFIDGKLQTSKQRLEEKIRYD